MIKQRNLESISLYREYRPEYERLKKSLVRREVFVYFRRAIKKTQLNPDDISAFVLVINVSFI